MRISRSDLASGVVGSIMSLACAAAFWVAVKPAQPVMRVPPPHKASIQPGGHVHLLPHRRARIQPGGHIKLLVDRTGAVKPARQPGQLSPRPTPSPSAVPSPSPAATGGKQTCVHTLDVTACLPVTVSVIH